MTRRVMILGDLADPNFGKVVEMTEQEFIAFARANTWPLPVGSRKANVRPVMEPVKSVAPSRPRKLDIETMPLWAEGGDAVTK